MKTKNIILLPILALTLLFGCSKVVTELEPVDHGPIIHDYAPGYIVLYMKSHVTLDMGYNVIAKYNLSIERVISCVYGSDVSLDSLSYVEDYIKSKSYFGDISLSLYVSDSIIYFNPEFLKLDSVIMNDWLLAIKELRLIDILGGWGKTFTIKTPLGTEQLYIDSLTQSARVAYGYRLEKSDYLYNYLK